MRVEFVRESLDDSMSSNRESIDTNEKGAVIELVSADITNVGQIEFFVERDKYRMYTIHSIDASTDSLSLGALRLALMQLQKLDTKVSVIIVNGQYLTLDVVDDFICNCDELLDLKILVVITNENKVCL